MLCDLKQQRIPDNNKYKKFHVDRTFVLVVFVEIAFTNKSNNFESCSEPQILFFDSDHIYY